MPQFLSATSRSFPRWFWVNRWRLGKPPCGLHGDHGKPALLAWTRGRSPLQVPNLRIFMTPRPCATLTCPPNADIMHDDTGRFQWSTLLPLEAQIENIYKQVQTRDPDQREFLQAFREVLESLIPLFKKEPKYINVLRTMAEPERMVIFRVPWLDDNNCQQVNRGFRVQFSSALGPYKGGLRFHPTVNLSVIKFLGFEQMFKNALTGLPLGAGKGGSDLDPRNRSDAEILRFCQSFMTELYRHIGADIDVPAGDINVGGREIGYLFGQYKRLSKQFEGVLTGKSPIWGGSLLRPEATGYGCVYFAENWAKDHGVPFEGTRCLVSGSGNVSQYAIEKLIELKAIPLTASDSDGTVVEPNGFTSENLKTLMHIKNNLRLRISDYAKASPTAVYYHGQRPWGLTQAIMAFPCATQNEIDEVDATHLAANGCQLVAEGANMPSTPEAIAVFRKNNIALCPAKAANAGGVAVSGLEMAQNSMRTAWTRTEVDARLRAIMKDIYQSCKDAATAYAENPNDLASGANIAGFLKVAQAVIDQGCV